MQCVPIINQKGGVGKTATSVNLGAAMAQRGKRVLMIDFDPQGHLTTHLGLDGEAEGSGIYEVLTKNLPLESAIHPYSPTVSVVPARIDLAAAEVELVAEVGREVILRDILAERDWPYDIVVIDCPPSLGVLTLNALCAGTHVLIPVQPHFLSLQGVSKLFETIQLVTQRINKRLVIAGMVMCLFEPGTRLSGEVIEDLTSFLEAARGTPVPWCDAKVLSTRIRRCIKLAEAPSYGQSILEYAPRTNGAADYLALADEFLEILNGPADEAAEEPISTEEKPKRAVRQSPREVERISLPPDRIAPGKASSKSSKQTATPDAEQVRETDAPATPK